jgi:uncharacterized pyridoxal phosphate-containing UPF0001 family protein
MQAYEAGQRILEKIKFRKWQNGNMMQNIQWHMIGHVQTNKVKYMAPFVA